MTAKAIRSLIVVSASSLVLAGLSLIFLPNSGGGYVWRGAVLSGIVLGNLLTGIAFCVVAGCIAWYIKRTGSENSSPAILWAIFWFLTLDGLGHLVGITALFLPREWAAWTVGIASAVRTVSAVISLLAAMFLPSEFRRVANEPTKAHLKEMIAELQAMRGIADRESAPYYLPHDALDSLRSRLDALIRKTDQMEGRALAWEAEHVS